jgi:amino acid transporter
MLLLIRGATESARVNAIMVITKLGVLVLFIIIAITAVTTTSQSVKGGTHTKQH